MRIKRANQKNRSTFVQRIKTAFGIKQIVQKRGVSKEQGIPLLTEPYEGSDKTIKRKRDRDRSELVWNSKKLGTYVRSIHGELF